MPPSLALLLWLVLLAGLFRYDPAKDKSISPALWIPLLWMALIGSRSLSVWLDFAAASSVATALEEGNALDHAVYLLLMLIALGILVRRAVNWRAVFTSNVALAAFILFALLSVSWSDFPLASFRRWTREIGNYLMVLVVLTDRRPVEAVEALVRRISYLLIPISVVVIKYFRHVGVWYSDWTGAAQYVGVTQSKNMLGVLCLISALYFFWDTLRRWPTRKLRQTRRVLFVNFAFITMTLWLLNLADSVTSRVSLVIGCAVIILAQSHFAKANPRRLKVAIPLALVAGVLSEALFDISGFIAQLLGRDPTLTGRTEIWAALLDTKTNPIFGVGYESFWLGDRLLAIWRRTGLSGLNEAHNGYLETYLNLGMLGLCLLTAFLVASYRGLCAQLAISPRFASFGLALWAIVLVYNVTESAFKNSLLWFAFLLVGIYVPRSVAELRANRQGREKPITQPRQAFARTMSASTSRQINGTH